MSKYYAETHEWAEVQADGSVWVGISEYAQKALGDIVFISFPEVGSKLGAKEHFGDVESVKAVSELFSPLSGTVLAVNEELIQAPEKLNEDALGTWILKLEGTLDTASLMDEAAYLESVKGH